MSPRRTTALPEGDLPVLDADLWEAPAWLSRDDCFEETALETWRDEEDEA